MPPTVSSSWTTGQSWRRAPPSRFLQSPGRVARALSLPSWRAEAAMDRGFGFLDAVFQEELIERYFPAIMAGMAVTIEIAAAVVLTGISLGLLLAIVRPFRLPPGGRLTVGLPDIFSS